MLSEVLPIRYDSSTLDFILECLYKEYQIYLSIFSLEKQKTDIIIQNKSKALKVIIDEQKKLLDFANVLEQKRTNSWENDLFLKQDLENFVDPPKTLLQLHQLNILDISNQEHVFTVRSQYLHLIQELEEKRIFNEGLLLENHNFFLSLLSIEKQSLQVGYDSNKEKKNESCVSQKPFFVDVNG